MNPEVKKKWVEALKSGKYKQGQRALHLKTSDGSFFCCLGVLCDLYIKNVRTDVKWESEEHSEKQRVFGEVVYLPKEVKEWADLHYMNPVVHEWDLANITMVQTQVLSASLLLK